MSKNVIIKGAIILTLANIITRVLGFIYRIYMSNLIGAEGMGLYQLIIPIYMLVWSISSSGLSTTISKLVAEENCKREYGNTRQILKQSIYISLIISTIASVYIFLFSEYIGIHILKDERVILSLHIMCISFPFMAVGSCIRGYFLGMQMTEIPAISQVLEQISRMICIYFLASIFIPMGLSYACAVGVIGMSVGEIFSFLYVYIMYKNKSKHKKSTPSISRAKSLRIILAMALPLTANRVLGSFLATIENILIPQKLVEYGYSTKEAISIFGQLSGMTMPLVMFPSSLLTALSIAIVPAISEAVAMKNVGLIKEALSKSFLFTSIIGLGTAGVFIGFSDELGFILYGQEGIGKQLLYIGFLCPLLYFHVTFSGILNGLGEQMLIFKNSIISSIITISFIFFLIPIYDITAFIIGWLISLVVVNSISIFKLKSHIDFSIDFSNSIFKPVLSMASSCILSVMIYSYFRARYGDIVSLLIGLCSFSLCYLGLLISLDCFRISDFLGKR